MRNRHGKHGEKLWWSGREAAPKSALSHTRATYGLNLWAGRRAAAGQGKGSWLSANINPSPLPPPSFPSCCLQPTGSGQGKEGLRYTRVSYTTAMPGAGAEKFLPCEGQLRPVFLLLPASSSNPSLQNTPCPCSWESESLTSLLTVWFLQTIHSKHATESIAPGDTNTGAWSTLTWSCLVCGDYRPISAQGATRTHSLFLCCSWYSSPLSRAHKASGCTWLRVNICFARGELKIAVCQRVCWKGLLLCPKHTQGFLFFTLLCHPAPNLTVLPHISHKVSGIKIQSLEHFDSKPI